MLWLLQRNFTNYLQTLVFQRSFKSDNGSEFCNALARKLTETIAIKHWFTTPYHPRANGVAEWLVCSLKDLLPKILKGKIQNWDDYLPMVELQLNTKVASLHSSMPFSLFYGRAFTGIQDFFAAGSRLLIPKDLDERLEYLTKLVFPAISEKAKTTQKQMLEKFNHPHHITEFPVGSHVMIKDEDALSTLDAPYEGPFWVVWCTTAGTYILCNSMNWHLACNNVPEQLKLTYRDDEEHKAPKSYVVESIV